jgi:hypothetical protein
MFDPTDEKAMAKLRELYPDLTDSELRQADLVLTQYLELAWEIYEESVLSKRPNPKKILSGDFQE